MARLPPYVRMNDTNGMGFDTLQLAAIMYAGSKGSDDDCLQIPEQSQPEPEPVTAGYEEKEPETVKKPKGPRKGSFFNKIGKTLGSIFTPIGEDDEGDELT